MPITLPASGESPTPSATAFGSPLRPDRCAGQVRGRWPSRVALNPEDQKELLIGPRQSRRGRALASERSSAVRRARSALAALGPTADQKKLGCLVCHRTVDRAFLAGRSPECVTFSFVPVIELHFGWDEWEEICMRAAESDMRSRKQRCSSRSLRPCLALDHRARSARGYSETSSYLL